MPDRLFLFVQFEFPWALGPSDGRYLLRSALDGEPERVVILATLRAPRARSRRRPWGRLLRRLALRKRKVAPRPERSEAGSARVTIVDPIPLSTERQARAWLSDLKDEREIEAAVAVLNRVLYAQRIASADPYLRELSGAQASTIRAGWGEGEQVAEGRWLYAIELSAGASGARRAGVLGATRARSASLRAQERFARLLGARERPLLCEELALRARLDLDQHRIAHAALELHSAFRAALIELAHEQQGDLPLRVAELGALAEGVADAAHAALPAADGAQAPAEPQVGASARALDEQLLRHSLGRLEAVLRARSARQVERA